MTWGSNATGTRSQCNYCGQDEYDDIDDWPYTSHYYVCTERGLWKRLKKALGFSNLPKAKVIKS